MALLDRLAQRFGYIKARSFMPPAWLGESADSWPIPDYALASAHTDLYKRLSWVQIAVSIPSQVAAGTALSIKKRVNDKLDDVENHPFEILLQQPNPLQSRHELLEATFAYRALTGNGYWWLNRTSENEPPSEIWNIPSHRMKPVPDGKMGLRGYRFDPGTGRPEILLDPFEVVHFKRFNPSSLYVGLSPIEALATIAIGDLAMQQWNTNHFSKDNAKLPGFLAFADPINDTDWAKMKADIKDQYGGTKRGLMMLRNMGKGGVEWVSTAMSNKDMEFLAGRTFNKEEIYSIFAPGLSSVLSVNATEANSVTGKATFIDMAVWPALSAMAEKITNDVLPAYGDSLVAEFDDIRVKDRTLELQEQQAFERVHTIAEVREKYYGDKPLGDARDDLLPSGIGVIKSDTSVDEGEGDQVGKPSEQIFGYHIELGVVSKNEARKAINLPEKDEAQEEKLRELQGLLSTVQAAVNTGIPLKAALELVGMDVEVPDSPPPAPNPFGGQPFNQNPNEEVPPPDEENADQNEDDGTDETDANMKGELKTWQRFTLTRMKAGKARREFETEHIPASLKAAIEGALESAQSADVVRHIFADAMRWSDYP